MVLVPDLATSKVYLFLAKLKMPLEGRIKNKVGRILFEAIRESLEALLKGNLSNFPMASGMFTSYPKKKLKNKIV